MRPGPSWRWWVTPEQPWQAIEAGAAFRAIADRVGVIAITEPRRQQSDWQRMATRHLASARTEAALDRYAAEGMVHRHATREAARAGVVAAWDAARRENPGYSQIILAHERVDVRALNDAARAMRRVAGELGLDHVLPTELGSRAFAESDRLYFLKNERGLGGPGGTGVKNGTRGTLERVDGERLTVRLDGPDGAGQGRAVTFDLAEYAHLDHGYAATVHKNQGATVDQAHVLATPGMDRHLIYVAMSRHRQAVRLHWGEDDFGTAARLRTLLGRERAKDMALDYAAPELEPEAAYAERRGLNPLTPVSEIVVRPDLVSPALAPDLQEDKAPGVVPLSPARGMFVGLGLSDAPLDAPASVPEPSPLSRAVARYLAADSVLARMNREGLPALPHQRVAIDTARAAIETLRPGFTQDLVEVVQRQPALSGPARDSAAGLAALIEAAGRLPAEREAEARRKAEQEALAPLPPPPPPPRRVHGCSRRGWRRGGGKPTRISINGNARRPHWARQRRSRPSCAARLTPCPGRSCGGSRRSGCAPSRPRPMRRPCGRAVLRRVRAGSRSICRVVRTTTEEAEPP